MPHSFLLYRPMILVQYLTGSRRSRNICYIQLNWISTDSAENPIAKIRCFSVFVKEISVSLPLFLLSEFGIFKTI